MKKTKKEEKRQIIINIFLLQRQEHVHNFQEI